MELTYETMYEWITNYFDSLPSIEGVKDIPRFLDMFHPDFKIHRLESTILNREEWVDHLCEHADQYRATVSYEPDPLGIFIDEKRGWATTIVCEEFLHPETKEEVEPRMYFMVIWKFCIYQNKVRAKRELINGIQNFL